MFTRELGELLLGYCYHASENEMEPGIRDRLRHFADTPYTDAELYDCLASVAGERCDRVGTPGSPGYFVVGYISGVIQAACDVERYYERPVDGGPSAPLSAEARDRFLRDGAGHAETKRGN